MEDLQYWLSEAGLENGSSTTTEIMKYTVCTDASQKMWGMSYGDIHISGEWTKEELQMADSNINALELLAIEKALFKLNKEIQTSILVRSDNTTAVSCVNNMGGHGSDKCNFIARKICLQKNFNMMIHICHILNADCVFCRHVSSSRCFSCSAGSQKTPCTDRTAVMGYL